MPFKRTNLEVTEVSFVDKPAVQKAKVFMTKGLGKRISILKMKGGENLEKGNLLKKFQDFVASTTERMKKAVGTIGQAVAENQALDAFWDRLWDVKYAFSDLVYDIIDDDTITDKVGALYGLIDDYAAELKTTANLLLTMQKGAEMDEKKILGAVEGIGKQVEGFGKRLDAIEAKGGKQPEGTEKAAGAEAGNQAGAETAEGRILAAVDGIGKKVEDMGKRLDDIERQPSPSGQAQGQEITKKADSKWPSFSLGGR